MIASWEIRFEHFISSQPHADVAHDHEHIRRVVRMAKQIGSAENAQLAVVVPAAWLHDCISVAKDSPHRAQASRFAADAAVAFLESAGYNMALLPDIHHAIEAHSFSAGIPPQTLEAKVVQDADRLDAIGAVGLARCLMLGGSFGAKLYSPNDPFCNTRMPEDTKFSVDHFFAKLLKLKDSMQTEYGRAEAEKRTLFLQGFLEQLQEEIL